MALAVSLPKKVAIQNKRLVLLHGFMVVSLAVGLVVWKFGLGHEYAYEIGITTQMELSWDIDSSIRAMEANIGEEATPECAQSHYGSRTRWGHEFSSVGTCVRMCTLDSVLTHDRWSSPASSVEEAMDQTCWSDFKKYGQGERYTAQQFLERRGRQDVSLITAKNDWIIDHAAQSRENRIEMLPQGRAGYLKFEYFYELSETPPWFFWLKMSRGEKTGTNNNARTVILDAERSPVGDAIPPGNLIELSIDEVWRLAKPFGDGPTTSLDVNGLTHGAEILARVDCFGTDDELEATLGAEAQDQSWKFGASISDPVCALKFTMSSEEYQIHVNYATTVDDQTMYATEVVSETTGIHIVARAGHGQGRVPSLNVILLNVTSMIVLLALPIHVTSFIATRALGPLSSIYKRVIIEPFDVVEATAATALVVAASSTAFRWLARGSGSKDHVTFDRFVKLMNEVFDARTSLNEKETLSLANVCFDAIATRSTQTPNNKGSILDLVGLEGLGGGRKHQPEQPTGTESNHSIHSEHSASDIVNMDQFNQIRLINEKITFNDVVQLFDKDRPQGTMEEFFTPRKIKRARFRAMETAERLKASQGKVQKMKNLARESTTGVQEKITRLVSMRGTNNSHGEEEISAEQGHADAGVQESLEDQNNGHDSFEMQQMDLCESANVEIDIAAASSVVELRREFDKLCERVKAVEQHERESSPLRTGVAPSISLSQSSTLEDAPVKDAGSINDMCLRLSKVESTISKLQQVLAAAVTCDGARSVPDNKDVQNDLPGARRPNRGHRKSAEKHSPGRGQEAR